MNGDTGNSKEPAGVDIDGDSGMEETVVIESNEDVDNVGDISVEINVEELVAKIEAGDTDDLEKQRRVKQRLEELEERIGTNLDSTYNINLDDD